MNEEQKLPLNESSPEPETAAEPDFDEDCQFLEDIQKRKADGPTPATEETVLAPAASGPSEPEDFVDMDSPAAFCCYSNLASKSNTFFVRFIVQ